MFPDSPGYRLSHVKEIWEKNHNFRHLLQLNLNHFVREGVSSAMSLQMGIWI